MCNHELNYKLRVTIQVSDNDMSTADVINDLRRMPLLKKININGRLDCDYILKQISLSNRNLEELYIFNCTGKYYKIICFIE